MAIAVDQLRADYIQRFRRYFGPGGFNLFLQRGASFPAARYEHATTQTCVGHAVILTGSHASVNGMIANEWYDKVSGKAEYCAADSATRLIGVSGEGRSPRNLIGATVGDVLKAATGGRSRVVTVSAKDRSAIMLGGHEADAAYWMVDSLFVTSTYYRKELPDWVRAFNASGAVSRYIGKPWERVLPAAAYALVGPDDVSAEQDGAGMGRSFPHPIGGIEAFDRSPFGNDVVAEFAMQAVTREGLGSDSIPDILGISFSANDRVGHVYGPDSHEVMDVTIRTDRVLQRLFDFLDRQVGLANILIVLTADHGVAPLPEVMAAHHPGIGARRVHPDSIAAAAASALTTKYGAPGAGGWIAYHDLPLIYLNTRELERKGARLEEAERVVQAALSALPGVHEALTYTDLARQRLEGVRSPEVNGFHPRRSPQVYYALEPYLLADSDSVGTDHGSRWAYDTQVPLLWFGAAIAPGTRFTPASVADIAPTIAAILGVIAPGGAQGRVLHEILR